MSCMEVMRQQTKVSRYEDCFIAETVVMFYVNGTYIVAIVHNRNNNEISIHSPKDFDYDYIKEANDYFDYLVNELEGE